MYTPLAVGLAGATVAALNPIGVGALAWSALAFRAAVCTANTAEAEHVIAALQAGEEAYRSESIAYRSCSDDACWRELGVRMRPGRYTYAVVAGVPGQMPPAVPGVHVDWPVPTEPWYVVIATGDSDGDGVSGTFVASSFGTDTYSANECE